MKIVECNGPLCDKRRLHWCRPFENRPRQKIEVPDDYEGLAFCSITCAVEAGHIKVRNDT